MANIEKSQDGPIDPHGGCGETDPLMFEVGTSTPSRDESSICFQDMVDWASQSFDPETYVEIVTRDGESVKDVPAVNQWTVDRHGWTTNHTFDNDGNIIQTIYPDGTKTLNVYDALNRLAWQTVVFDGAYQPLAITTQTDYDALGRVAVVRRLVGQVVTLAVKGVGSSATLTTVVAPVRWAESLISTTRTLYDVQAKAKEFVAYNAFVVGHPFIAETGAMYGPEGEILYSGPFTFRDRETGRTVFMGSKI